MSKKAKVTTNIDEDIFKQIKIRAIKENMNVGELIEKAFSYYIADNPLQEKIAAYYKIKDKESGVILNVKVTTETLKEAISKSIKEAIDEIVLKKKCTYEEKSEK